MGSRKETGFHIRSVFCVVLLLLMAAQIVMGAMYFALNIGKMPQYRESYDWIAVFPWRGSLPYLLFRQLFQTWIFFLAVYDFTGIFEIKKGLRLYISLFILTVPMLLQYHVSLLSTSIQITAFVVLFGTTLRMVLGKEERNPWIFLVFPYVLSGLLWRGAFWLYLFWLLPVLYFRGKKYIFILLFLGLALFSRFVLPSPSNEIQRSLGASALSRFVWPNFATNYFFWDEEVKKVMSLDEAVMICEREDAVADYFGPKVEKAYGKREANRIYYRMAFRCLKDRTRETVLEILEDFEDYLLLPFAIQDNLAGKGTSLTAWNYGRMKEYAPFLGKVYFRYTLLELPVLLVLSILMLPFSGLRVLWKKCGFAVYTFVLFVVWFTMRSNMPVDYRLGLPLLFLWFFAGISGLILMKNEEGGRSDEKME